MAKIVQKWLFYEEKHVQYLEMYVLWLDESMFRVVLSYRGRTTYCRLVFMSKIEVQRSQKAKFGANLGLKYMEKGKIDNIERNNVFYILKLY